MKSEFNHKEILVDSIEIVGTCNKDGNPGASLTDKKIEALLARFIFVQTGAFGVKFYDDDCFLSISNMMYHEIMMVNGFSKVYEFLKCFRKEIPSSKHRLAEFTMLVICMAYTASRKQPGH